MKRIFFIAVPLLILLLTLADSRAAEKSDSDPDFNPLKAGTRFFQTFISPVDGPRCSMVPTCSVYAVRAADQHGFFLGTLLTVDRLLHEVEPDFHTKPKRIGKRLRWHDPVEDNTFWWHLETNDTEQP